MCNYNVLFICSIWVWMWVQNRHESTCKHPRGDLWSALAKLRGWKMFFCGVLLCKQGIVSQKIPKICGQHFLVHATFSFILIQYKFTKGEYKSQVAIVIFGYGLSHVCGRKNRKQLGRKRFRVESSDRAQRYHRQSWGVSWHSIGHFFRF